MSIYTCASWENYIISIPYCVRKSDLGDRCFLKENGARLRGLEVGGSVQCNTFFCLFSVLLGERDFQINLEWIENIAGDGLDFVKVCLSCNRILFLPPTFIIIIIALYLGSIHCRRLCTGFECCWWEQRLTGTIRLYHSFIPGFIHWAI